MTRTLAISLFTALLFAVLLCSAPAHAQGGVTLAFREGYLRNESGVGGEHIVSEVVVGGRLPVTHGFGVHLRGRIGVAADVQTPRAELNDRVCTGGGGGSLGSYWGSGGCGIDIDWRFPIGVEAGVGYVTDWRVAPSLGISLGFDASLSLSYLANTYERVVAATSLGGLVDASLMANIGTRAGIGFSVGGRVERDDLSGSLWFGVHGGIRALIYL